MGDTNDNQAEDGSPLTLSQLEWYNNGHKDDGKDNIVKRVLGTHTISESVQEQAHDFKNHDKLIFATSQESEWPHRVMKGEHIRIFNFKGVYKTESFRWRWQTKLHWPYCDKTYDSKTPIQ